MAKILIVDDDVDLAETVAEILRLEGHEIRMAHDGEEGLKALRLGSIDLVVMDVEMPVLDGPGMAWEMFVRNTGLERVPVVLVSGHADLPRIVRRVGTPYFLGKPTRLEDLLALVELALAERLAPARTIESAMDGALHG